MNLNQSFKSPKVRILTGLALFFAITTCGALWLGYAVKDQVKETADDLAPAFSADMIMAAMDDRKGTQLAQGEWQAFLAHRYAWEKNYKKAHEAYLEARDYFTQALGKEAPLTYAIVGLQAHFEYQFGKYALAEGLFREELASLQKTHQSQKQIFYTQEWLANTLGAQDKVKQQIVVLTDALRTAKLVDQREQPSSQEHTLDALDRLSFIYGRTNQYDKQEETCEQALTIARRLQDKQMLLRRLDDLAEAKCQQGDPVSAIKVDSEALILDPTSISTYAARALAYSNVHDYKHAIEDMNTAVKLDCTETNHWALWSRAGIYEKSGDYQRAIDDYTSAIARSNRGGFVAPLYDRRAKLFQKVGRPKDAISDYTEILNHSADPSAFVSRGDLYQKILQPGLAIEDYTKALAFTESAKYQRREENPISSKTVYEKRAKAYTALGKSSLAEADRLQAQRETASEKPKATAAASKL